MSVGVGRRGVHVRVHVRVCVHWNLQKCPIGTEEHVPITQCTYIHVHVCSGCKGPSGIN